MSCLSWTNLLIRVHYTIINTKFVALSVIYIAISAFTTSGTDTSHTLNYRTYRIFVKEKIGIPSRINMLLGGINIS